MSLEQDIDWSRMKNSNDRMMIQDYYEAAEKAGALHLFETPISFSAFDPALRVIDQHLTFNGHSGSSYQITMRQVHYIVRYGYNAFIAEIEKYEAEQRLLSQ